MPESRDRLSRPVDVAAFYARRRVGGLGIISDQADELFRSPIRPQQQQRQSTEITRTPAGFAASASQRRGGPGGGVGSPTTRFGGFRGRIQNENTYSGRAIARRGRGRGRGRAGTLPSWYPRTPLRDITGIVRAIERRRARLREGEDQDGDISLQDQGIVEPSVSNQAAQLEHDASGIPPPRTAVKIKHCPLSVGKVPKILLGIASQSSAEPECLTPQKKLLNSIDKVEKVVMEELQKLKKTPAAKKAERERRVRTLMSMR